MDFTVITHISFGVKVYAETSTIVAKVHAEISASCKNLVQMLRVIPSERTNAELRKSGQDKSKEVR